MYYNIVMEKGFLIEATKHLYQLTLLFPKKEPLRYKLREKANDLLDNYLLKERLTANNPGSFAENQTARYHHSLFEIQKNIDTLLSQLEIVKYQNWVSYFEVLELQEKYQKVDLSIKGEIKEIVFETKEVKREEPALKKLDSRKEKIIEVLKNKEKIQVKDIVEILPKVSKRTIRRDFNDLIEKGIIKRIGSNNETFYALNR